MRIRKHIRSLSLSLALLCVPVQALATSISIDPLATFLFTHNDPWSGIGSVPLSSAISLSSLGINGGDLIQLDQIGNYYDGHAGYGPGVDVAKLDVFTEMIGVFSSSNALLAPDVANRVPGALNAGIGIESWHTLFGNMATDIPDDFRIANTIVQVPMGANYLFVAAHDIYYSDNSDPDGNYGVKITQVSVPEPGTWMLVGFGLAFMFLINGGVLQRLRLPVNRA
jgi:PEP-CTERM motif